MPIIKLNQIKNTKPLRAHGDIAGLCDSIKSVGLINPLTIDENYNLMAGRRRYQALIELGLQEAECYVLPVKGDQITAMAIAIDENIRRKDLTEVEKAVALAELDELKRKQYGSQPRGNPNLSNFDKLTVTNDPQYIGEIYPPQKGWTQSKTAQDLGISQPKVSRDIKIANAIREYPDLAKKTTGQAVLTEFKRRELAKNPIALPEGKYRTIVIDPPWPVEKIIRDVSPNQYDFDYPTMSIDGIKALPIREIVDEGGCHIYLWTTQRFLPIGFEVLKHWEFSYIFTMVWHKAGGFQPFNLPQYNCEFVLFGRTGGLPFEDTKGFFTCFGGERRQHSRKPDQFYELVKRVSPPERIDYFSREKREGFKQYGDEVSKF